MDELVDAPLPEPPQGLPAGTVLAGRFVLVRHIATGGMGEVYEANDLELGERVALKTVRRDVLEQLRDPNATVRRKDSSVGHTFADVLPRLKREISLARRVTHPNVCRMLEFGHHEARDGNDVTFLTMELLGGETLESRLTRGPLSIREALPIVRQMADGLQAAHDAGVIHRDLKSANVMLVPRAGAPPRAVLTDFGLARNQLGGDGALTEAGIVVGTANYMAPEQAEGEAPTPQTDIYALGVVMFEMLTGAIPHLGSTPLATITKRVKDPPPSPRTVLPDLDPTWERVILRCLAMRPEARFARAADVADVLEGKLATGPHLSLPDPGSETRAVLTTSRRRLPGAAVAALAGAILLVVAGPVALRALKAPHTDVDRAAPGPQAARRSVAVLGFKSRTGKPDAAWLSTALAEMLSAELAAGEELFAVPGESVSRLHHSLALPESDSLAPDTLKTIRTNLNVDYVVLGSYLLSPAPSGAQLRVDVSLQDAAQGSTLATLIETGPEADLLALVTRAGAKLREKLGLKGAGTRSSLPSSPEATRLYTEGLHRLRGFDALAARDLLAQAVEKSPENPLARVALAEALATLGYQAKARTEAEAALLQTRGLGREEKLWVEAAAHERKPDWPRAVDCYQALFQFFPDNLEYGVRLASAQSEAGQAAEALATIAKLRALPPPASTDPRIDLAEAVAAERVSDYRKEMTAAEEAIRKGRENGARLLVASAQLQLGTALRRLGDLAGARTAYDAARQLFDGARHRGGAARALHAEAVVLRQQGETAAAAERYEKALSVFRELGDQGGTADALNDLAVLVWKKGKLGEARDQFWASLTIRREIGDLRGIAESLNNLGDILVETGDLAGARKVYDESLRAKRDLNEKGAIARILNNLADLALARGALDEAQKDLDEAHALAKEIGNKRSLAYSLHGEGEVALARGDAARARQLLEEALAIRREIGDKTVSTATLVALAQVALADGRAEDAERLAGEAAAGYTKLDAPDGEARALAVQARALARRGKKADADKAARRALQLAERSENRGVRLTVRTAAAKVLGGPDAERTLDEVRREATESGFVRLARDAQPDAQPDAEPPPSIRSSSSNR